MKTSECYKVPQNLIDPPLNTNFREEYDNDTAQICFDPIQNDPSPPSLPDTPPELAQPYSQNDQLPHFEDPTITNNGSHDLIDIVPVDTVPEIEIPASSEHITPQFIAPELDTVVSGPRRSTRKRDIPVKLKDYELK